jgi:hypothetical protein
MRFVWALLGLLYALVAIYVGYQFFTAGTERLGPKGILLQAPPILGGIALVVLAIPLIWNCVRLVTARVPRY